MAGLAVAGPATPTRAAGTSAMAEEAPATAAAASAMAMATATAAAAVGPAPAPPRRPPATRLLPPACKSSGCSAAWDCLETKPASSCQVHHSLILLLLIREVVTRCRSSASGGGCGRERSWLPRSVLEVLIGSLRLDATTFSGYERLLVVVADRSIDGFLWCAGLRLPVDVVVAEEREVLRLTDYCLAPAFKVRCANVALLLVLTCFDEQALEKTE